MDVADKYDPENIFAKILRGEIPCVAMRRRALQLAANFWRHSSAGPRPLLRPESSRSAATLEAYGLVFIEITPTRA